MGKPHGELVIQTIAMPANTNPGGDIFGGWLLSQMDLGGAMLAYHLCQQRVVTVAIDAMSFLKPVKVGDTVSCYARVVAKGRSSVTLMVEAWARPRESDNLVKVTEGHFKFVAIDTERRPVSVDWDRKKA